MELPSKEEIEKAMASCTFFDVDDYAEILQHETLKDAVELEDGNMITVFGFQRETTPGIAASDVLDWLEEGPLMEYVPQDDLTEWPDSIEKAAAALAESIEKDFVPWTHKPVFKFVLARDKEPIHFEKI